MGDSPLDWMAVIYNAYYDEAKIFSHSLGSNLCCVSTPRVTCQRKRVSLLLGMAELLKGGKYE
jgi:hypothetical protein